MIKLEKGQKIDLTKGSSNSKFYVGLSWDAPQTVGGYDYDCDVSAIILDANGKILDGNDANFVYYGLAPSQGAPFQHKSGAIRHSGDNLTGAGDGDDERLTIDTAILDTITGAEEVSIVITIYDAASRGQNFGSIKNAVVHLHPADGNNDPVTSDPSANFAFDLNEDYSLFTALQVGSVYKKNGEWKFDPIGQGFKADLAGVLNQYGAATA